MSSRPRTSGRSTSTWRSKRPGRSRAGSSVSGRLVAAITITPLLELKPSISTSRALSVCSRSSWPPTMLVPRVLPRASSSSMKTMQGALAWACWNMSRTRAAPTPTNISTKSEPERLKNGTPASPAIALASSVLPVPGGPTSSTPLGMRPPRTWYFSGVLRKSTTSRSSSTASSMPATSSNVTPISSWAYSLPRLRPKAMAEPAPPIRRSTKNANPTISATRITVGGVLMPGGRPRLEGDVVEAVGMEHVEQVVLVVQAAQRVGLELHVVLGVLTLRLDHLPGHAAGDFRDADAEALQLRVASTSDSLPLAPSETSMDASGCFSGLPFSIRRINSP